METPSASKCPSVGWSYAWPGAVFDGFELDGKWNDQPIHRERQGCESDQLGESSHYLGTKEGSHSVYSAHRRCERFDVYA